MPTYSQHATQATHNGELLSFIATHGRQADFSDWYVTIAFYTALHHFEALIAATKPKKYNMAGSAGITVEHGLDHSTRNRLMKTMFGQVHIPYFALYQMSRTARYDCHAPSSHSWADAEVYLDAVKKECKKLIP